MNMPAPGTNNTLSGAPVTAGLSSVEEILLARGEITQEQFFYGEFV